MVHNTKKKALYEVIGRAGSKSGYEQLHPNGTAGENPSANPETSPNVVRWVRRPSFVQFNAGRIEFSIPYQVGIAIALGMLLAAVVLFRLGQRVGNRDIPANTPAAQSPWSTLRHAKAVREQPKPVTQDTPVVTQPTAQDTSAAAVAANQPTWTGKTGLY